MEITVDSNPWTLPGPPVYVEGIPSAEMIKRDEAEANAKRIEWKPGPDAFSLLDQLRTFVSCDVLIQGWSPIMLWMEEDGPFPIQAKCVDVITRNTDEGFVQAFLVLKDPHSVSNRDGYDALNQLIPEKDEWLFGIGNLYKISHINR